MIVGLPIPFEAHTKLRIPLASASVQAGYLHMSVREPFLEKG